MLGRHNSTMDGAMFSGDQGGSQAPVLCLAGVFTFEGSPTRPKQPPIVPTADNVVGWLRTTGILAALRRRAIGEAVIVVSLTRTVLWLLSLGIFDKGYAKATARCALAQRTSQHPASTILWGIDRINKHRDENVSPFCCIRFVQHPVGIHGGFRPDHSAKGAASINCDAVGMG
jgi:hypothetical protein